MTLEQAYAITNKMSMNDHRNPTKEQSEAKRVIYEKAILPRYGNDPDNVPPHLEPDFNEGWHQ